MPSEVVEIGAPGALQIAAALAQHAEVEQCRIEPVVELERAVERGLGVRRAAGAVVGDAEVIRGVRAEQRVLVREDGFEIGDGLPVIADAQTSDAAVEARRLQIRIERERLVEAGDRLAGIALEQQRQAAQVLDIGRRCAGGLRALELAQRRVVVPAEDVPDAAVACGLLRRGKEGKREEQKRSDAAQAAPRTCSSIWMSPRLTAFTNASTTRGSKRVPAKLLIFSTT